MDTQILRAQISICIKLMEQGRFQQFCTDFIPLVNVNYKGLHRHGATAFGKTRKGTPDSIKTVSSGSQTVLQASVDENYWKKPQNFEDWKPISDLKKCFSSLTNLEEIILCSSQEIPTNTPNAESEIHNYAKGIKDVEVVIYTLPDLENELIDFISANYNHHIVSTYFPNVYNLIKADIENEKAKLLVGKYGTSSYNFSDIKKVIEDAFKQAPNSDIAKDLVDKKITALRERFEINPIPKKGDVDREISSDSTLLNPLGKYLSLIGVVKIGKTSLIHQCVETWVDRKFRIKWFKCPDEEEQKNNFCLDILKSILEVFLPVDIAMDIAINSVNLSSIPTDKVHLENIGSVIFVVDEAENLTVDNLKRISTYLARIKELNWKQKIGIIFVSNKSFKKSISSLDEELVSRQWRIHELRNLITIKFPSDIERLKDDYIKQLQLLSGGHPLIALALAKKYSTLQEIVLSLFSKSPAVLDEDLDEEVKKFLFEDVLEDKDDLSLVLRMSVLVYQVRSNVIEILMKKIQPVIGKSQRLIIEKLLGTVLEGNEEQGYSVVHLYKTIAKGMSTQVEGTNIYKTVGDELLQPKREIINSIDVIEGAYYAMLSHNQEKAFYWSVLLLQHLPNSDFNKEQKRAVIDGLEILSYIVPKGNEPLFLLYVGFITAMGMNLLGIGDFDKAFKLFERLKESSGQVKNPKVIEVMETLEELVKFQKSMIGLKVSHKDNLNVFVQTDLSKLVLFPEAVIIYLEILEEIFKGLKIDEIPTGLLHSIFDKVNIKHPRIIANVLSIALSLGAKINNEEKNFNQIVKSFKTNNFISEVFINIAEAEYKLEKDLYDECMQSLSKAVRLCSQNKFYSEGVNAVVSAIAGDLYYRKKDNAKAYVAYKRAQGKLGRKTFNYAWVIYRLGLLSIEAKEARLYFNQAGHLFEKLQLENFVAKSLGEEGVACVQLGDYVAFAEIAEKICLKYYQENNSSYAPAAAIILGQMTRLSNMIDGKPIIEISGIVYPEFKRKVYDKVLDIAKPRAGAILGFYGLSLLYNRLKDTQGQQRNMKRALSYLGEEKIREEIGASLLVIKDFLDESIPNGDLQEVHKIIWKGINLNILSVEDGGFPNAFPFAAFCFFNQIDQKFLTMSFSLQAAFFNLLGEIIKQLDASTLQNKEFWKSDVYIRMAKLGEKILSENEKKFDLWRNALILGEKSKNDEVIYSACHTIIFFYAEFLLEWNILIEHQLKIIKSISKEREGVEKVQRVGQDLIKGWTSIYQNILLIGKTEKRDCVLSMLNSLSNAGIHLEIVQLVVILLIAGLDNYHGFATDYVVEMLKQRSALTKLPPDILNTIKQYL